MAFELKQEHLQRLEAARLKAPAHGMCPSCGEEVTLLPAPTQAADRPAAAPQVYACNYSNRQQLKSWTATQLILTDGMLPNSPLAIAFNEEVLVLKCASC